MTEAQTPRIEFCKRPFCEKPSVTESEALKPDSCPVGNDAISASEYAEKMAEALAARALCPSGQEPQAPLERPLCPPNAETTFQRGDTPTREPTEVADSQGGTERPVPTNGQYSARERPICLPPQAFADANNAQERSVVCLPPQAFTEANSAQACTDLGDGQTASYTQQDVVKEDTRPPQITECREPPATNTLPPAIPGACASAEGNDPGEVRCCIKRCEISPEIFEKDPCALPPPDGPLTSEYYKTTNLPFRFDNASGLNGYGCQQQPPIHPFYRTTSQDYGWFKPSIHTVPTGFYPQCEQFSKEQGVGGRYRNTSLDTAMAEKLVED